MIMAQSRAITTTDHDEIRRWVEAKEGYPAVVDESGPEYEPGQLRIDYAGYDGEEKLRRITWEEFFERFDRHNLAFFYHVDADQEEQLVNEG
jgi:hypothetical protein